MTRTIFADGCEATPIAPVLTEALLELRPRRMDRHPGQGFLDQLRNFTTRGRAFFSLGVKLEIYSTLLPVDTGTGPVQKDPDE